MLLREVLHLFRKTHRKTKLIVDYTFPFSNASASRVVIIVKNSSFHRKFSIKKNFDCIFQAVRNELDPRFDHFHKRHICSSFGD